MYVGFNKRELIKFVISSEIPINTYNAEIYLYQP